MDASARVKIKDSIKKTKCPKCGKTPASIRFVQSKQGWLVWLIHETKLMAIGEIPISSCTIPVEYFDNR